VGSSSLHASPADALLEAGPLKKQHSLKKKISFPALNLLFSFSFQRSHHLQKRNGQPLRFMLLDRSAECQWYGVEWGKERSSLGWNGVTWGESGVKWGGIGSGGIPIAKIAGIDN
jgi:hypothetical protein